MDQPTDVHGEIALRIEGLERRLNMWHVLQIEEAQAKLKQSIESRDKDVARLDGWRKVQRQCVPNPGGIIAAHQASIRRAAERDTATFK